MKYLKPKCFNYVNANIQTLPKDSLLFNAELRLMPNKRTMTVRFYSTSLNKKIRERTIYINVKFNKKQNIFYLEPIIKGKNRLYALRKDTVGFAATNVTKKVKLNSGKIWKCAVLIRPTDFGFKLSEQIIDKDASKLYKELVKLSFLNYPIKVTPNNHCGDLLVSKKGKICCIHISIACPHTSNRKIRSINRHRLFGKIIYQAMEATENLKCKNIVIINKELVDTNTFNETTVNFLKKQVDLLIFTDFSENWERKVANIIAEGVN